MDGVFCLALGPLPDPGGTTMRIRAPARREQPRQRKETEMSAQVLQQTSYTLTLSGQERDALLGLLRQAFTETRVEAHRTHSPNFRELVLGQESLIRDLVEKLEHLGPDQAAASPAIRIEIEEETPVIDELYIDGGGRFQMAAADLEDFIPFLRDHEVCVDVEAADAFRSGGAPYGYGRLAHPYDIDSVAALYRTWRQAQGSRAAGAMD
jgi:hypothetical protein